MASRSLCTLRGQRHRWTTQHSVPAGSLRLAGQVHLLLGHLTRFRLTSCILLVRLHLAQHMFSHRPRSAF
jgi:hypothetical protein